MQGYPTSKKLSNNSEDPVKKEFVTIQPVGSNKHALDTMNNGVYEHVASVAVEAGSTDKILKVTGHDYKKGDVVRFLTTANSIEEAEVAILKSVDADNVELAAILSDSLEAGDTVSILRPVLFKLQSDGAMVTSQGPIQFNLNGSAVEVNEDTGTPANNAPLPVKLTGATGDVNITAGDLNVQLSHLGASHDSTRIGDGTNIMAVNASLEAQVRDDDANTALGTINTSLGNLATEATLGNVALEATQLLGNASLVSILAALGPVATEASLASIDGKVSTEATLAALSAKFNSLAQKASANSAPVVLSTEQEAILSAIVTAIGVTNAKDFSTEATLAALNNKFGTLSRKVAAGSAPVVLSTEDKGVLDTIDLVLDNILARTPVLGEAAAAAAVPVVLANNVDVRLARLDVVDQIDTTPLLSINTNNIPASSAGYLTVVASLASDVKRIKVIEDIGEFIGMYDGANTLLCVLPQGFTGGEMDIAIPSGTAIKLRNMKDATIATDTYMAINFLG